MEQVVPLQEDSTNFGGYFLIDKPIGITSFDCVNKIKHMFPGQKVGHCGTLDPLASGLLIVAVGSMTKELTGLIEKDKEYIAKFQLGLFSDTDDLEGVDPSLKLKRSTVASKEKIIQTLKNMQGEQLQTPPQYSAKSVNGVRAYKLARQGKTVELKDVLINIKEIEVLGFDNYDSEVEVRLKVSKGTYIRSIARSLGEELQCGAYMSSLKRISIGQFSLSGAKNLENLTFLDLKTIKTNPKSIACIGKFDGMHNGHTSLLNEVLTSQYQKLKKIAIITNFENQKYLMRIYDRQKYLYNIGFDLVIVQTMNSSFMKINSEEFTKRLKDKYNATKLITGPNQKIGNDQFQEKSNIKLIDNISTTLIKEFLDRGEIVTVNKMLSHKYCIEGRVIEGKHIGKTIGFPTANINYQNYHLPKIGVYYCNAILGTVSFPSIVSVSKNPTISGDNTLTVEAHLIGYKRKDFYGKFLKLEFEDYIRDIVKFDSLEELKSQLSKDLLFQM